MYYFLSRTEEDHTRHHSSSADLVSERKNCSKFSTRYFMAFSIALATASSRLPLCSMALNTTMSSSISFSISMYCSIVTTRSSPLFSSMLVSFCPLCSSFNPVLHSRMYCAFRNCASSSIGGSFRQSFAMISARPPVCCSKNAKINIIHTENYF